MSASQEPVEHTTVLDFCAVKIKQKNKNKTKQTKENKNKQTKKKKKQGHKMEVNGNLL